MLKLAKVNFFSKHVQHKHVFSLNSSLYLNSLYGTDTDKDRGTDTEIPKSL